MDRIAPESAGFSSTRLNRIGTVMQRYVDQGKLAGVITAVARRGGLVHLEKFGMMDLEADKPMQFDTIFRIYSMTKPITSVAMMRLYEEGLFQIDDPVSRFIPEFKDVKVFVDETESGLELVDPEREVTIRDLFTHTSGLVYGDPQGSPVQVIVSQSNQEAAKKALEETLEEWIARVARWPLAHQPGSAWRYGHSTDVLGRLVEVISGLSLDVFLEQRIYQPLGMVDTGFHVPEAKLPRFAANYGPAGESGIKLIDALDTRLQVKTRYAEPRRFFSGGGGLVSTTYDYLRFAQMLLDKGELNGTRLLGRKTVEWMTVNHLPAHLYPLFGPAFGFGLGFAITIDGARAPTLGSVGSYSWAGWASTFFWVDPQEALIGILMTQFTPFGHYPIDKEFRVLTYQALVD